MRLDDKRPQGKWWLCAGCAGFALTSFFIAATLYLGEVQPPARPPRFRQVVTQRLPRPTTPPPPLATSRDVLDSGPDPVAFDELFPVRQNSIRKKSEAAFPPNWVDEVHRPVVVDPQDFREDFSLPGFGQPEHKDFEFAESKENPLRVVLQKRLRDIYDFVGGNKWLDLVESVNKSVYSRDISYIFNQLKTIYYNSSSPEFSLSSLIYPSRESLTANSSSLVSLGLLAIDLFLLHNVQQIALSDEDPTARNLLSSDPEVTALNALFLPPERLKGLSRSQEPSVVDDNGNNVDDDDDEDVDVLKELADFARGALTGAVNLGRAYKRTTAASQDRGRSVEPSPLDCIWTLYCRNLDKTATLAGPYGFLAKMNGLGLRLMMGEFPVEKALEKFLHELTRGWSHIECQKLFPRCSAEEARVVVMETAIGDNPVINPI